MLIAIYALLSWVFIFDGEDINDEAGKVKKEQNVKIINEDGKEWITACRNLNNNFFNQETDSYGLELYYFYNNMEKRKNYGVYFITPHIGYRNDTKKNKILTIGSYINKNQRFLIYALDNTFVPTIRIECEFNQPIEVLGKRIF